MLKLYLAAGVSAVAILGGLVLYARHEHGQAVKARAVAEAATRQAQLSDATTKTLDHYTDHVTVIHDRQEKAVADVQKAPGSDQPVPDAVLGAWRDGLRSLSGEPESSDPGSPQG